MQLNEILEEHSVKSISTKTNISENNLEYLIAEDFANISKVKTLGFISIIEREYGVDLGKFKELALSYYEKNQEEQGVAVGLPVMDEKKGRSKWVFVVVLGLLAYASWYFLTQFDKKNLSTMLPFTEEKSETSIPPKEKNNEAEALSINNALSTSQTDSAGVETDIVEMNIDAPDLNVNKILSKVIDTSDTEVVEVQSQTEPEVVKNITLVPDNRLWFGLIHIESGKRDHHSISAKYEIDVEDKSWLVATSSAPFAISHQEQTQEFNDAKEHYFKLSGLGIESLSKTEYIAQGGYKKW